MIFHYIILIRKTIYRKIDWSKLNYKLFITYCEYLTICEISERYLYLIATLKTPLRPIVGQSKNIF